MSLRGKKLGLVICSAPDEPLFGHAIGLAEAAISEGVKVYLYYMDEAVHGLVDDKVQELKEHGANLFACAYSAQKRSIPLSDTATFAGLAWMSNLLGATDKFLVFP